MTFAGAACATYVKSVAGPGRVTSRCGPQLHWGNRVAPGRSSAGGAGPVRLSQRRCPRLEPYDGKLSRTVLRGGGGGNAASLPGSRHAASIVAVTQKEVLM
jgi:hypothetical protein